MLKKWILTEVHTPEQWENICDLADDAYEKGTFEWAAKTAEVLGQLRHTPK